ADALAHSIDGELLSLETVRPWQRNPMTYARLPGGAIDGLMKRDFAPAAERLRSVIARLKQVPAVYAAAQASLATPPREITDVAIRMTKGAVHFFEASLPAWAPAAAAPHP